MSIIADLMVLILVALIRLDLEKETVYFSEVTLNFVMFLLDGLFGVNRAAK